MFFWLQATSTPQSRSIRVEGLGCRDATKEALIISIEFGGLLMFIVLQVSSGTPRNGIILYSGLDIAASRDIMKRLQEELRHWVLSC